MKLFKKNLRKIFALKKFNKKSDIIPKIISLAYLSTVSENVLHDKNANEHEKNPTAGAVRLWASSLALQGGELTVFELKFLEQLRGGAHVIHAFEQIVKFLFEDLDGNFNSSHIKKLIMNTVVNRPR